MNKQRIVVLGLALVAAVGAALVVRGMMGGGTPKVVASVPAPIKMSEVLVANDTLQPGQKLEAGKLRWQQWPAKAVDSSFITHDAVASIDEAAKNTVVRAPILANQPVTSTAIVHADAAGFMAAILQPGMRAVSITISTESGAGGFILPNDRVDLMLTQKSTENPPRVRTLTILSAVRVLAVDQTYKEEKDQKTVLAKSATLELTPAQAELVTKAAAMGQLSLSLRPLDASDDAALTAKERAGAPAVKSLTSLSDNYGEGESKKGPVVIRYGVAARVQVDGTSSDAQQNIRKFAQ
ncbi:MAG: Flp pilus assembly protein CpaB [Alphaproteobacteria bacterium]|nr:Flp pilus assembly protein CpaB [Alphaproteobacteria bacterium]